VPKSPFETLSLDLEDACNFLRSFATGKRGFASQDGAAGIKRVSDLCDRMKEQFSSGPNAANAATALTSAEKFIKAAREHLALLKGKD
jgi:hypothetical protein